MQQTTDVLIIGGGIIGMATALEIQRRSPSRTITVLEKEPNPAQHQSARNSGVVHAGIYYKPNSLKAKFCAQGVIATQDFCREHNLPYDKIGKLIVATDASEVSRLQDLSTRARKNGIVVEDIDQTELRKMEPHIQGLAGLYSPNTAITDYQQITCVMENLFVSRGGVVRYGETVTGGHENQDHVVVKTHQRTYETAQVVSCAGLQSDRIIRAFGQTADYRVIPFRGEFYRIHNQPDDLVSHLIYPVPDPERPFLGVHLTRKIAGGFTVGPNAVLAFKREGYTLSDISIPDMVDTLTYGGFWRMLGQNAGSAVSELTASLSKRAYLKRIHKYCPQIQLNDLTPYPAGVRAQAVHKNGAIIDDFLFVETPRCLHVGNAPSPAATSAIPIANYIVDKIK